MNNEIDRYIAWPGQALSYMIGRREIVRLRDRARAELGSRFNARDFHGIVLSQGAVPLPVLGFLVDAWTQTAWPARRGAVLARRLSCWPRRS